VDAAPDLAHLLQRAARLRDRPVEAAPRSPSSGGTAARAVRSFSTSVTSRCWGAVGQVRSIRRRAWSAAATMRARRGQLGPAFGVSDGGRDELGEVGQPLLGVGGQPNAGSRLNPSSSSPE
jgi:hypothetical protein